MAHITVVKHKRPDDFQDKFAFFKLLNKVAHQIDSINEIHESTYYITDHGLEDIAIALLRDYISLDSEYIIVNDIEVFREDNMLVVITE
jgi:hypothetical protein